MLQLFLNFSCELKFLLMLLQEIKIKIKQPMMFREDNTGAIFITNNDVMSQHTKHIDTRHHFVREMIANKDLIVKYIRSERKHADLVTKN